MGIFFFACVSVDAWSHRGQKRVSYPLELDYRQVKAMKLLGTKFKSFASIRVLNHGATALDPTVGLFTLKESAVIKNKAELSAVSG